MGNQEYTQEIIKSLWSTLDRKILFGHEELIRLFSVAYFSRGHVLVEGPPGTGKTLTAKSMAALLANTFRRIQFTTDMLPSDLIGAQLYNPSTQKFDFIQGPIFADFIIADEINRTPPRTQSALLEAMEERQVTVEGHTYQLSRSFFVIATQNPQDFEGTYPLPESQLDRFMFKLLVQHGTVEQDTAVMAGVLAGTLPPPPGVLPKMAVDFGKIEAALAEVRTDESIVRYVSRILEATRTSKLLQWGSSVRGGIAVTRGARMLALAEGRGFVSPDDVKAVVIPALRHRIKLTPDAQIGSVTEEYVLQEILKTVPFPT